MSTGLFVCQMQRYLIARNVEKSNYGVALWSSPGDDHNRCNARGYIAHDIGIREVIIV